MSESITIDVSIHSSIRGVQCSRRLLRFNPLHHPLHSLANTPQFESEHIIRKLFIRGVIGTEPRCVAKASGANQDQRTTKVTSTQFLVRLIDLRRRRRFSKSPFAACLLLKRRQDLPLSSLDGGNMEELVPGLLGVPQHRGHSLAELLLIGKSKSLMSPIPDFGGATSNIEFKEAVRKALSGNQGTKLVGQNAWVTCLQTPALK